MLNWGLTMNHLRKVMKDAKGATAIEYGLIAALIAVAAVTAMSAMGNKISQTLNNSTVDMR
jgi:pilus assembly protein Flp/PilA